MSMSARGALLLCSFLVCTLACSIATAQRFQVAGLLERFNLTDKGEEETNKLLVAQTLNYCRESLCKITHFKEDPVTMRLAIEAARDRIVNNVDVTKIKDEAIQNLMMELMTVLKETGLDENKKDRVRAIFASETEEASSGALKQGLDSALISLTALAISARSIAAGDIGSAKQSVIALTSSIYGIFAGRAEYNKRKAQTQRQLEEELGKIDDDGERRIDAVQKNFFAAEVKLWNQHDISEQFDLKENQLDRYVKILKEEANDAKTRLSRLQGIQSDFQAYPPFWYQIGKAAQDSGKEALALQCFENFEKIYLRLFREDADYVMLCMSRIQLSDVKEDRDRILKDLEIIEKNVRYYYQWEVVLFAALKQLELGNFDKAKELILRNIQERYAVRQNQQVMSSIDAGMAAATIPAELQKPLEGDKPDYLSFLAGSTGVPGRDLLRRLCPALDAFEFSLINNRWGTDALALEMSAAWTTMQNSKVQVTFGGNTFSPDTAPEVTSPPGGNAGQKRVTCLFKQFLEEDAFLSENKKCTMDCIIGNDQPILKLTFEVTPVVRADSGLISVLERRVVGPKGRVDVLINGIEFRGKRYVLENGIITPYTN